MEPLNVTYDVLRSYVADLEGVDPALIAKIDGFRRSRNLAGLTSCSSLFDWKYHTVVDWRTLRQVEAFFKKNSAFSQKDVCSDAARSSFMAAEHQCHLTNVRLKTFIDSPHLLDEWTDKRVKRMKRYISNALGDFDRFLGILPDLVRVTPGATSHRSRRDSLPQMKMRMRIYCTKKSSAYIHALYHYYGFKGVRTKASLRNRVELVPKNWKTDRTIACEPEGNLCLQLAFDKYAKRRLRRVGIDLSDQSRNQRLAKEGSINGNLVTVDFSSASDTISYNAVSLLFPVEWQAYLDRVRTPGFRGAFGDGWYAKFSSMGNGATFTIETLIFAAACAAVGSKCFSVYGDDVIIEKECYEDYLRLTRFLGFTINVDKTFSDGPFRESCGKDYFDGVDVTPKFIRNVDKRKACLCHLVNVLGSVCSPGGELEALVTSLIRDAKLPFVPYSENSLSGVWILPDKARHLKILRRRRDIDTYRSYTAKYKKRYFVDSRGYYLWFLYKNSQVLFSGPWEATSKSTLVTGNSHTETSWAPVFDHAYVRKRVCWHPPAEAIPDHLYWWSDVITRSLNGPNGS